MPVINMYHHSRTVPAGSINIMRGSEYGNPYKIGVHGNREMVVKKHREYLDKRVAADPLFAEKIRLLHGETLCCCCAPQMCHGDTLLEKAAELQAIHEQAQLEELEEIFGEMVQ